MDNNTPGQTQQRGLLQADRFGVPRQHRGPFPFQRTKV
jgi:hypothetical protein